MNFVGFFCFCLTVCFEAVVAWEFWSVFWRGVHAHPRCPLVVCDATVSSVGFSRRTGGCTRFARSRCSWRTRIVVIKIMRVSSYCYILYPCSPLHKKGTFLLEPLEAHLRMICAQNTYLHITEAVRVRTHETTPACTHRTRTCLHLTKAVGVRTFRTISSYVPRTHT